MDDVYHFFDKVISLGVYTNMLPKAICAIQPILKEKLSLPFEGLHLEMDNEDVAFDFNESDIKKFWDNFTLKI